LRTSSPARFIFGDDFRNSGKIEFVGRPPGLGTPLLIAVVITPDAHGRYNIASFYPVSEGKVQSRKQKGFIKSHGAQKFRPRFSAGPKKKALAGLPTSGSLHPFGLLYQDDCLGV
jgi:hypothetical protein